MPAIGIVCSVLIIWAFLIALLFLSPPFSYTGLSFLFCAFNMLPMTAICSILAPGVKMDFQAFISNPAIWSGKDLPVQELSEEDSDRKKKM